jgi:hypothetical protein
LFRVIFLAVAIGTALLVVGFLINMQRPRAVTEQPTAALIAASGCADCHANLHYSIVHEYELSVHARKHINCLECHQPTEAPEWPWWVLVLALGGFGGNFIFSLTGHAQNGFFYREEWLSVAASGLTVGFLLAPFLVHVDRGYLPVCAAVLLVQSAVGVLGFTYHLRANLRGPAPSVFDNFVYGAPVMAPLLFPNLALLAFIGPWPLRRQLPERVAALPQEAVDSPVSSGRRPPW